MLTVERHRLRSKAVTRFALALTLGAAATLLVPVLAVVGFAIAVVLVNRFAVLVVTRPARGRGRPDEGGDFGGVREPRRPKPPAGSAVQYAEPPVA